MTFMNVLKWERFSYRHVARLLQENVKKIISGKKVDSCGVFSRGPRLHTTTIPFESTRGELWAVWKSRLIHGHRGALSRILDRMPSNPCCLAASQEFILHGTTWEEALGAQEEGKQQRHPLFQRRSFRVWVQSAGAWGALCLHSAEVSGWVFGFGGFDVQRTSLL